MGSCSTEGVSRSTAAERTTEYRIHHGPAVDLAGLLLLAGLCEVAVLVVFLLFSGFAVGSILTTFGWLTLAIVPIVVVVWFLGSPRVVILGPQGIQVDNRITSFMVGWGQLTGRTQFSLVLGDVRFEIRGESAIGSRARLGVPVSVNQARSIVRDHHFPVASLTPRMRRSLGLPPDPE